MASSTVFPGPPPAAGAELTAQTRVAEIYEKEGKRGGTMTFVVTVTEFRDAKRHARGRKPQHHDRDGPAARRQGPAAEPNGMTSVTMGRPHRRRRAPQPRTFGPLTRTDFVRYQGASGDFNPIHHDEEFAKSAGLPDGVLGRDAAGRDPRVVRDRLARRGERAPLLGAVPRAGLARRRAHVHGHRRGEATKTAARTVDLDCCAPVEAGGSAIKGYATFVVDSRRAARASGVEAVAPVVGTRR